MRAVVIARPGGADVLDVAEVARPEPAAGEVLVRVHATALNRADLLQREGRYPPPAGVPANIPGLEIAGEVAELGHGVTRWQRRQRVFGIVGGGAHAEYCITRAHELAPIPQGLSWEEAAAVPEAFMTAHDALVTLAALRSGESVLVHAVGSGVGLAAVQLVRAFGGICFGTARSPDKIDRAREYGLRDGIVVGERPEAILDTVRLWTSGRGADVVLDLVGGTYLSASVQCAAVLGRIVLIGLLAGRTATLDLGTILSRRITVRGTVLRTRPAAEKAAATEAFARDVVPLFQRNEVRPVIDSVFSLDDIRVAHRRLESNASFGKIVIRVAEPGARG